MLVIVTVFSAMYCGFFALRGEMLYDFDQSESYYNTMFFESAVQRRMAELRRYVQENNREARTLSEEEETALCFELKEALLAIGEDLISHYSAYGFSADPFEGCVAPEDYLSAFREKKPELRDKPDEEYFFELADEDGVYGTEAQWRAYDLMLSGAYEFSAGINEEWFTLPVEDFLFYPQETDAYAVTETTAVDDEVPDSVPVTAPRSAAPAAADTATLPSAVPTTAVPTTAAPARENADWKNADFYRDYSRYAAENDGAVDPQGDWDDDAEYRGSERIARWLAECYSLRSFLVDSVGTADPEVYLAAEITVQSDRDVYGTYNTSDIFDDSFAQYLFYYPKTGEYITNIREYMPKPDAPMFSSDQSKEIRRAVAGLAEKSPWRVIVTADRAEHNVGNGTDGESSLRQEALGYSRMSYCMDAVQAMDGELYFFGDAAAHESDIFSYIEKDFGKGKIRQPVYLGAAAVSIVIFLLSAVYILAFGTKAPAGIDHLYNDWHFLLSGALAAGAWTGGVLFLSEVIRTYGLLGFREYKTSMADHTWTQTVMELTVPFLFACGVLVLFEYLVSVIRNGRNGRLIRHSFWFALPRWFVVKARSGRRGIPAHYRKQFVRALIAGIALILALCITEIALSDGYASGGYTFACLLALAVSVAVLVLVLRHLRGLDEIAGAAERIRNGDMTAEINVARLPKYLRPMADSVLRNRDGIKAAVEQSVRDERMKTALITNVSHDLKTPLTSIITYSDLLSKRELSDEEAEKYVGVINEKAITLKRLIEDLVEASKASTGNIRIERINLNLYEIAVQAVGEYADELENRGVEVVVNRPKEAVIVSADSRQTWRIIENLLSNVKKYAMRGTRVYIDVRKEGGYGIFEIKNVSESPLNIPAEELTQRFVRGDAARTTEGSGLGLSIARSLCELQGGRFEISIDGDLFKVCVALPLV